MRGRWQFPALMLAMAAIYVAYSLIFPIQRLPDTNTYVIPARAILDGQYDTIYRVPVYPLFLAGLFRLGLDEPGIVAVQHVIAWLSIALIYWIALAPLGRRCAVFCALIYGISLVWLGMQHVLFSEALFVPLSVVCLAVALRGGLAEGRLIWTAVLALLMMLAALTRPVYAAFVACVPALLLVQGHVPLRRRVAHAALFCLVCGSMLTPWLWRQSGAGSDAFTPIAARNLPVNTVMLLKPDTPVRDARVKQYALGVIGLHRYADGGWTTGERNEAMLEMFEGMDDELGISEAEVNRAMTRLALDCIRYRPLGYLWTVLVNLLTLLLTVPVMALLFGPLMLLLCRRQGRPRWKRPQWLFLTAHVAVLAVITALFEYGMPRYTMTFWAALCLLFTAALQSLAARGAQDQGAAEKSG